MRSYKLAEKKELTRLWSTIPLEQAQEIERVSNELGMSMSQLAGMCLLLGFKMFTRVLEPEKVLSVEQLFQVGMLAKEKGLLPEEEQIEDFVREFRESKGQ